MEVELNREAIRLPRLSDVDDAAIPEALTTAHKALRVLATEAVARVAAIHKDTRISESERAAQLAKVAEGFVPEAERLNDPFAFQSPRS
jgi:hypothetical protein